MSLPQHLHSTVRLDVVSNERFWLKAVEQKMCNRGMLQSYPTFCRYDNQFYQIVLKVPQPLGSLLQCSTFRWAQRVDFALTHRDLTAMFL